MKEKCCASCRWNTLDWCTWPMEHKAPSWIPPHVVIQEPEELPLIPNRLYERGCQAWQPKVEAAILEDTMGGSNAR